MSPRRPVIYKVRLAGAISKFMCVAFTERNFVTKVIGFSRWYSRILTPSQRYFLIESLSRHNTCGNVRIYEDIND